MADFTKAKLDIISKAKQAATDILNAQIRLRNLKQEAIDAGFTAGGINPLADGDIAAAYPSLVAADVTALFTASDNLETTLIASSRSAYKALVRISEA